VESGENVHEESESDEIRSPDIVVSILIGNGWIGLKEVGFRTPHVHVPISFEFIIIHLESHIPICRVARVFYINFEKHQRRKSTLSDVNTFCD
jgi:hypothetical protein